MIPSGTMDLVIRKRKDCVYGKQKYKVFVIIG